MNLITRINSMSAAPQEFAPVRFIERLGFHHGDNVYRVAVNEITYTGATEAEAICNAFLDIMQEHKVATVSITPTL